MDISRRKRRILQEIISLYTLYGDPVGSKLLGQMLDEISVSSATIRNDMAELTSLGFLEQPYTSSGRVPTVSGYRYYIENLLRIVPLKEEEKEFIDRTVDGMDPDPGKAAELAAQSLVKLTGLAAIVTTPRGGNIQITRFELIRSGKFNVGVIGITGIGGIRSRVCRLHGDISDTQLRRFSDELNRHLLFISFEDISSGRLDRVRSDLAEEYDLFSPILSAALSIISSLSEVRVYIDGQQHLLSFSELEDSVRRLLELFSDSQNLCRQMEGSSSFRILVADAFGIERLGMVVGRYRATGGRYGEMAVTGPTRMDYGFVIPRLSYFRDRMSEELTSSA